MKIDIDQEEVQRIDDKGQSAITRLLSYVVALEEIGAIKATGSMSTMGCDSYLYRSIRDLEGAFCELAAIASGEQNDLDDSPPVG